MQNKITIETFDSKNLDLFSQLDDFDIISALKSWQKQDDFILSSLSKMIINRDLLKIKVSEEKVPIEEILMAAVRPPFLYDFSSFPSSFTSDLSSPYAEQSNYLFIEQR